METPAANAPSGSFSSFLLLVCGTLVAAVLGAAHRLGLLYRLLHKVRGHRREVGCGQQRKNEFQPEGLVGRFFPGPCSCCQAAYEALDFA